MTQSDQPSSAQDYVVILGKPGTDPLTIVGPFVSMEYGTHAQAGASGAEASQ